MRTPARRAYRARHLRNPRTPTTVPGYPPPVDPWPCAPLSTVDLYA